MNLKEISQEERDLWRFEASDECGTPSEDDERILRLLKALEASEADLERSCEETRANFSELYRMANEVVPELKKRVEAAEARAIAFTTEPPKVSGVYLCRRGMHYKLNCVEVYESEDGLRFGSGDSWQDQSIPVESGGYEWAGPISALLDS